MRLAVTFMAKFMPKSERATFDTVQKFALALPGVEEGISYGTPAFRVKGKFLARLKEDGNSLVIRIDSGHRDFLMKEDPQTFYITEHYRDYPAMLIRLSRVRHEDLRDLIENAWRMYAPKRMVAAYDKDR